MKIFITGACGFIGSHLAEYLSERHDVTAMAIYAARDTYGWLDDIDVRKVRGDVRDAEQMRRLIKGHDIVYHLAALGSVPHSYDAPRSVFETNVMGTLNVLEACREADAKIVHTSTSEVYGTALHTPQDERHPLQAQSPYAASKISADKLVESYHRAYGLPSVVLRPFNTYGPRQSQRAVIPTIIRQALDPRCKTIELGRLDTARDFTYVGDMVRAFEAISRANDFCVLNAGMGENVFIRALASEIQRITGTNKKLSYDGERVRPDDSEVLALHADARQMYLKTGWHPATELEDGLRETIDWWRERSFGARVAA